VFTVAISLGFDRYVYQPLRDTAQPGGIMLLIASIGVAFLLRYVVVIVYTPTTRAVAISPETVFNLGITSGGLAMAGSKEALLAGQTYLTIPMGLAGPARSLLTVDTHEAILVVGAAALMLGIHLLLQRTMLGKAMRAMADNKDLARARGIPTERITRWTWIIGSGITGIAGFLIVLERGTIGFLLGWQLLLLIFAAVILGGIGSVYGAILGGLIIGLASTVSLVWLPEATLAQPLAFLIMIVVLIVRPHGLFAGREVG
jgi:branched-chain amino acid transport system permease protein